MSNKTIIAAWLFGVLFLVSAMGLVWQFKAMQDLKIKNYDLTEKEKLSLDKKTITSDEDLLARLAEMMAMPEDKPVIYTVKDVETLAASKPFYKNAVNGDKMLLFRDRAILFRPSEGRMINVVGLDSLSDLPTAMASSSSATTSMAVTTDSSKTDVTTINVGSTELANSVEVRNGTPTSGLAGKWKTKLTDKGYKVLTIGNAVNDQYAETMVINLTGKDASKIEQVVGATSVTNMPSGEPSSQADVLIILGAK